MPPRLPTYAALLAISARGAWDPDAFELETERERVAALPVDVRRRLTGLLAGFVVGEEAVAEHLVPFGRAAEDPDLRACLEAQVVEEERHADAARRAWAAHGAGDPVEAAPHGLVVLFRERLPAVAARVDQDLAGAVALYHGLLEGVVFVAGQRAVRELAAEHGLPVLAAVFGRIERDERWHVALGARVLADAPDGARISERLPTEAATAAAAWGDLVDAGTRDAVIAGVGRRLRAIGLLAPVARSAQKADQRRVAQQPLRHGS